MNIKTILQRKRFLWIWELMLVIAIKLFSLNSERVEDLYTSKFYFFFSKILRFLFGWIPFSFGDILYFVACCWLLWKLIINSKLLFKKQIKRKQLLQKTFRFIIGFTFIYVIFNIFWGLNYNREGIAYELKLPEEKFVIGEMELLQNVLLKKVNSSKSALIRKNYFYPGNEELFKRAEKCYHEAAIEYPFFHYRVPSIKSSLYGWMGNYLGFTGYYNPFTGEAQVNTTVPKFLQPYIAAHEIAHQLGYAKENEANFAGYLAAVNSTDTLFHYSAYLDLFMYANRQLFYFDSVSSKQTYALLIPEVKQDIEEWRKFNIAHTNFLEPAITWLYGNYLKLNQQPRGIRSYNQVISMLAAYYKKYGKI